MSAAPFPCGPDHNTLAAHSWPETSAQLAALIIPRAMNLPRAPRVPETIHEIQSISWSSMNPHGGVD